MGYRYEENDEDRKCLQCGTPIVYGRCDKKFCSLSCKNRFHNREVHSALRQRKREEYALERNYSLLEALMHLKLTEAELSDLVMIGFRPEFYTEVRWSGRRKTICCFDISYGVKEGKVFGICREKGDAEECKRKNAYLCQEPYAEDSGESEGFDLGSGYGEP